MMSYQIPQIKFFKLADCMVKLQQTGEELIPDRDCGITSVTDQLRGQISTLPQRFMESDLSTLDYRVVFSDVIVSNEGSNPVHTDMVVLVQSGDAQISFSNDNIEVDQQALEALYSPNTRLYRVRNFLSLQGKTDSIQQTPGQLMITRDVAKISSINVIDRVHGRIARATRCTEDQSE